MPSLSTKERKVNFNNLSNDLNIKLIKENGNFTWKVILIMGKILEISLSD